MKIIPKTKKDFNWVKWGPSEINKQLNLIFKKIEDDIKKIKSIPKDGRTFENTILAIDTIGSSDLGDEDGPITFLKNVSDKKKVRDASRKAEEKLMKRMIDVSFDKELFNAFTEYEFDPKGFSEPEIILYEDIKKDFLKRGFYLPQKIQDEVKNINKRISDLSIKFSKNISSYYDFILCSEEDLRGLSKSYISNLKIDKKTKKRIVTLAYPELTPFLSFAESDSKRKELADKVSQRGGKENLKILAELLKLRNKMAKLLGFENYVAYAVSDKIAKKPENVKKFLENTIPGLIQRSKIDLKNLQNFVDKNFPGKNINYYNSKYFSLKMQKDLFNYDSNLVKEYFELNNVILKMLDIFGEVFSVSFKENKLLPKWHRDIKIFDVIENKKVIGHVCFDLFPRQDKFSHMACWGLMKGKKISGGYSAPVSAVVGNFPKSSKSSPSLLSLGEIETLFHEFGHSLHNVFTRAEIVSQAGFGVAWDFVEMPSQLFENWVRDKKILKNISKHYKTGKPLDDITIENIVNSFKFMESSDFLVQFVYALQDYEMHSTKYNVSPLKLAKDFKNKYYEIPGSPKSLFPAGWGHMTDYAAKYYSYMWAIVYAYDIFSKFKKDGIMNNNTGMDLRRKVLEKGGSRDEIKQMEDFLGRKPNNKAFLEALK
jgi:thimet oligopeptidase